MATTLRFADVHRLLNALAALDGRPEVVEVAVDGGDKTRPMIQTKPYVFSGKVRLAIARWIQALQGHNEALDKALKGLQKEFPDKPLEGERKEQAEDKQREILDTPFSVELPLLSYADLKAEDNQIPGTVLAALGVVLVD